MVMSTPAPLRFFATWRPPNPPPTITTRCRPDAVVPEALLLIALVPFAEISFFHAAEGRAIAPTVAALGRATRREVRCASTFPGRALFASRGCGNSILAGFFLRRGELGVSAVPVGLRQT